MDGGEKMSEKQGSLGDELDNSIDTGAGIAGEAVKQGVKMLPSRRPAGNRPDTEKSGNAGTSDKLGVSDSHGALSGSPSGNSAQEFTFPESAGKGQPTTGVADERNIEPFDVGNRKNATAKPQGDVNSIDTFPSSSKAQLKHSEAHPGNETVYPQAANQADKQPNHSRQHNKPISERDNSVDDPNVIDGMSFSDNNLPDRHENSAENGSTPAAGSPEAIANRLPEAQGASHRDIPADNANPGPSGAGSEAPTGIAGGAGAESGAGISAAAEGSGASAAGSSAGGMAGAGAGTAASGSAAASGAAAGGSTAGAAGGGAAVGATAGSAAGPAGTVIGAVAGALIVPAIKWIIKIVIMVTVLIMMFSMLPSFLFDNPEAVNDRIAIENTYNHFYEGIANEYEKDIRSAQTKSVNNSAAYLMQLKSDLHYAMEERVKLSDADIAKIEDGIEEAYSDTSEYVHWRADTQTLQTLEEYKEAISGNINMVLSMIDQGKKNWFIQLFSYILHSLTKGWFADFSHSVSSWWDGFWNDFIVAYLYKVEVTVAVTTSDTWPDGSEEYVYLYDEAVSGDSGADEDDEGGEDDEERNHCYITITFTYDMQDKGYAFYADKRGLDQAQIDRAAEMAAFLGDLFGSESDAFVPIYTVPGYYDGAKSGGTAASNIASALTELEDIVAGMTYDSSGFHAFPLQGKSVYPIASHYGPRNYPPDPWHTGIDFSIASGYPVCSVADGVVLFIAQHKSGFGNHIAVFHGSNVVTLYCHLNASKPFGEFRAGDEVRAGDVIGYVGRTGLSTGNHLHFQVHEGASYNVRNPVGFFAMFDYAKP
jgi:murein DD-endopeptidase MepM/ murein hydrolase activator NlpD